MRKLLFSLCFVLALHSADDDPWAKVKDLKSGTELRVFKKGASQALMVKMGDLTDENLIVIDKNEEKAIQRVDISRIDAKPFGKRNVTTETKMSTKDSTGDPRAVIPGPGTSSGPGTTTSTSAGISVSSKDDFETIYRRPPPDVKKSDVKKDEAKKK